MEEKKRYNLGVLIGGVHTYFPKEHIKGISEAASELDVNVCFFLGTRTKDFFEDVLGSKQKNSYDYQFNTIHDYSLIGGLDGLIINYGTLGIQLREVDPNEFARKYNGITTVFLTEVVDVPNCHSLICDNKGGIAMVISHLVEEHHLSRILFMAGPEHNTDAIERKEAYLETMKKYGLPVTQGMIAQGDYSEFVDKQVERLLDSNPDAQAIVFANDEMAFAGYRVCEKRGLVVGKDIMITGFDDCERASGMEPPLTTIQQDGELMGKMAVYDLVNRLDGKDPGKEAVSRRVPVSFVKRESCGCVSEDVSKKETPVGLGAQVHRLNKTIAGMKLELIYGVAVFAVCFLFARPLMLLFVKDEEVIRHGVSYLHLIAAMYLLPAATNGIQGYFRGIGDLKITLISSFINMGVRVLAALPLVFLMGMGIEALPLAYMAGWIGMLIAEVPLLVRTYRKGMDGN